ncbi:MAG: PQQ-binding-like beta-propeller repeat protein, partial [Chloroflexota bacterium]
MPVRKFFSLFLFTFLCILTALIFSSLPISGLAAPLLQSSSTPVYLPFIANQSGATEWTQHAHDAQRTSFTQQVVATPWRLKWIWNGPDGQGKIASGKFGLPRNVQPVTGGGRVYVAAGSRGVYALNNANGQVLWQQNGIGTVNSTPAYDPSGGTLLVVSANGRLYKLRASDGQVLDQFN